MCFNSSMQKWTQKNGIQILLLSKYMLGQKTNISHLIYQHCPTWIPSGFCLPTIMCSPNPANYLLAHYILLTTVLMSEITVK